MEEYEETETEASWDLEPACDGSRLAAIEECVLTALMWNRRVDQTEIVLRIDTDGMAREWRTEMKPTYELWVWSRDLVPGAEFELEWVFIPTALRPYRVQAMFGWRDLGCECNTDTEEEAEAA